MGARLAIACVLALVPALASPAAAGERRTLAQYRASAEHFEAGVASEERGLSAEARAAYERALADDPEFVEALVNLARLELAAGDLVASERWLARAEALRGDYPRSAATRGLLALAQGDAAHGLQALTRAHRLAPDDAEIAVDLAAVLVGRGRLAEARALLLELLRTQPDHVDALYNLALAHDLAGDHDAARLGYERFLALARAQDPDREAVRGRLEQLSAGLPPSRESSLAFEVRHTTAKRRQR
jgi:cytochrome c-type biogenesis protein CcmH/NrfG